jgi:hypothetical protein
MRIDILSTCAMRTTLALGALLLLPISVGSATIIDDFNVQAPGYSYFSTSGPPSWPAIQYRIGQSTDGTILGAQRDVYLGAFPGGSERSNSFGATLNSGVLDVATGTPGTKIVLQYDGLDDETGHVALSNAGLLGGASLTAGGNDTLRFYFNHVDPSDMEDAMDLRIILNNNIALPYDTTIPRSATAFTFDVPLSALGPSVSNLSSLEFQFNPSARPDVDFALTSITATTAVSAPEPGTAATLAACAASAAGVWLCRRSRRRAPGRVTAGESSGESIRGSGDAIPIY